MQLTASLDRRSASCLEAMTGIYRTILERIVADPVQVLRHRVSLTPWEKGLVAARSLIGDQLPGEALYHLNQPQPSNEGAVELSATPSIRSAQQPLVPTGPVPLRP